MIYNLKVDWCLENEEGIIEILSYHDDEIVLKVASEIKNEPDLFKTKLSLRDLKQIKGMIEKAIEHQEMVGEN